MAKKTKKGKNRLDKYYRLAKEQGYRSRAAFKLVQLNRKFDFLSNARAVLDLCAAPGGWLQVVSTSLPMNSLVLGVDLVPIKPIRGVKTLVADITSQQCRAALKREAGGALMDVVLHDGAPNVGGAWSSEAYSQAALVLDSLRLATEFLAPKGTFVTKVFRSKDYTALLYALNQLFTRVEATKPAASRNASAEIFVVALGYKAPAKIDPRLLDPRHLFQEVAEARRPQGPDALVRSKFKQVRNREGYEENVSVARRLASALTFIASEHPVEELGKYTAFALDGPESWVPVPGLEAEGSEGVKELADAVRRSAATSAEVRELVKDLQVLGRGEFKALLKWRLALRKELKDRMRGVGGVDKDADGHRKKRAGAAGAEEGGAAGKGEEGGADAEERLLAEMAEVKEGMEKRQKKEKKKRQEAKKKAKLRAAQMAQGEGLADGASGPSGQPDEMFQLASLTGVGSSQLGGLADLPALGDEDLEVLELSSDEEDGVPGGGGSEDGSEDSDDERLRYDAETEEALEESYRQYKERQGMKEAAALAKRRRLGMEGELEEDGEERSKGGEDEEDEEEEESGSGGSEDGEEQGGRPGRRDVRIPGVDIDAPLNPLLVTLDEERAGVAKTGAAMAAQWFKQDIFAGAGLAEEEEEEEEERQQALRSKRQRLEAPAGGKGATGPQRRPIGPQDAAASSSGSDSDSDGEDGGAAKPRTASKRSGSGAAGPGGFEVVPQEKEADADGSVDSEDSEDEFDMLDDQGKAEVLALAKRMLRRKDKESIIDAAYNRYAFHDQGLPRWFGEDESYHMRPIRPVTKEEIDAEKARLRAIDARPIRKVVEAKARKQRRMVAKLSKARQAATQIADQEDMPVKSRMREIEKVYAKARSAIAGKRKGKGKGGKDDKRGGKGGKKGSRLDKRMKADARGMKKAAAKGKKGGGRRR